MSIPLTSEIIRIGGRGPGGVPVGAGGAGANQIPGGSLIFGADGMNSFNFGAAFQNALQPGQRQALELETSPVQHAYLGVPGGDDSDYRYTTPHMLAFSVNSYDRDYNSTPIVSLAKLNQYMHDAYKDFEAVSDVQNPNDNWPDAVQFKADLVEFGEEALYTFALARRNDTLDVLKKKMRDDRFSRLERFWKRSTEDLFCWQTKYGILSRVNFLGPVINVDTRTTSMEAQVNPLASSHYCVFNIALGKRCEVANLFGPAGDVTTGTVVWLKLLRKHVFRNGRSHWSEFYIVPGGNKLEMYPSQAELSYTDPSGRACFGHRWCVGRVISTGKSSPTAISRDNAANIGSFPQERVAYEDHGMLPTVFLLAGFK